MYKRFLLGSNISARVSGVIGGTICPVAGAALIVNARSRTGEQAFERASELLGSLGVEIGASYALHDAARLPETVREAVGKGHDPIILGGGDGSVSSTVVFPLGNDASPRREQLGRQQRHLRLLAQRGREADL